VIRRYLVGFLLLALAEIGFSLTFVTGSVLTKRDGVTADVLTFCRFAFAGGLLLLVGFLTRRGRERLLRPTRRDWTRMLVLAPIGTTIMAVCVFLGCARVSVANASMADALTPLMIFVCAALVNRRISGGELVGLASGFIGALLVIQIVTLHGLALEAYTLGDVFIALSAAAWGVYTVYGRRLVKHLGSYTFTAWTMVIGAAALVPLFPFIDSVWPRDLAAWLRVGSLVVFSTMMPFWAWNAAQKYLPVSVVGVSAYFAPVFTMALGIMLLDEPVTGLQWLGTVFIIASASIETGRQNRRT